MMSFGLCNALGTFQICMMEIFSDIVERSIEGFMDDFSVVEILFDNYLASLESILLLCEEANLFLN